MIGQGFNILAGEGATMAKTSKDLTDLKETIESMQAQIITLEQRLVATEQAIAQIEDAIEALSVDP